MGIASLRHSSETVDGIVFFGRMLDKIRLHAGGKLPADYNRGIGSDHRICQFLKVEYPAVVERVLKGGSDNELLEWCFQKGRRLSEDEIYIFNAFLSKQGWRDDTTQELEEVKRKRGFADRHDIQTWFDFHRADEA
jgi:hypothetical protein